MDHQRPYIERQVGPAGDPTGSLLNLRLAIGEGLDNLINPDRRLR